MNDSIAKTFSAAASERKLAVRGGRRRRCGRRGGFRARDGCGLQRRVRDVQVLAREDRHAAEDAERDRCRQRPEDEGRHDERLGVAMSSIGHAE
jgi:hypothetical protein